MFYKCINITEIDLSHFDTSEVTEMLAMFYHCDHLTSINLSNLNTKNVNNMGAMFDYCYSLTFLDLSAFDTSNVTNMGYMFCDCQSLTSLNLLDFDTSQVTDMLEMFEFCYLLSYINLKNSKLNSSADTTKIFDSINNDLSICTKYSEWNQKFGGQVSLYINCNDDSNKNEEIICYTKSPNNFEYNDDNICNMCEQNYYLNNKTISNRINVINCHECYSSCETCKTGGDEINQNCVKCKYNFTYILKKDKYFNCYEQCEYYYYINITQMNYIVLKIIYVLINIIN